MTRWGAKASVRRLCVPIPSLYDISYDMLSIFYKIKEAQEDTPKTEFAILTRDEWQPHGLLLREEKIYVTIAAQHIKLDLLVTSHCCSAGHRGQDATSNHVKERFTWRGITDDIKSFVEKCLHCESAQGHLHMTRERAQTLHVSKSKKDTEL